MLKNKSRLTISSALTLGVIAAACILHFAPRTQAAESPFWVFGVSGIAPGETARLNVVTVGVRETVAAQLIFFDTNGGILMQTSVALVPGRAVSLDLPFLERSAVGNRLAFYPMVRLGAKPGGEGYVIPTVEVIDNATGRTSHVIEDPMG
jgi:hypothetical protein